MSGGAGAGGGGPGAESSCPGGAARCSSGRRACCPAAARSRRTPRTRATSPARPCGPPLESHTPPPRAHGRGGGGASSMPGQSALNAVGLESIVECDLECVGGKGGGGAGGVCWPWRRARLIRLWVGLLQDNLKHTLPLDAAEWSPAAVDLRGGGGSLHKELEQACIQRSAQALQPVLLSQRPRLFLSFIPVRPDQPAVLLRVQWMPAWVACVRQPLSAKCHSRLATHCTARLHGVHFCGAFADPHCSRISRLWAVTC